MEDNKTPSIAIQIEQLQQAGWIPKTRILWIAPNGTLHLGPHGAWKTMTELKESQVPADHCEKLVAWLDDFAAMSDGFLIERGCITIKSLTLGDLRAIVQQLAEDKATLHEVGDHVNRLSTAVVQTRTALAVAEGAIGSMICEACRKRWEIAASDWSYGNAKAKGEDDAR